MNSNSQTDNSTRDVFIAYSHGNNHENVSDIKLVCDELKKIGYSVFFDLDNPSDTQIAGKEGGLKILQNARCVLVFLDSSVVDKDPESGFYKEMRSLRKRIENDGFTSYRFYQYNGFAREELDRTKNEQQAHITDDADKERKELFDWLIQQPISHYRTGKEINTSLNAIIRDVDQMLHYFNSFSFNKWKRIVISSVAVVLLLIGLLVGVSVALGKANAEIKRQADPIIVFAGGVTTKGLIDEIAPHLIEDFANSIYINMGSRSAWGLLFEEQLRSGHGDYIPIVLSAEAVDTAKLKAHYGLNVKEFSKDYRIMEVHLGDIPLMVQLYPADRFEDYNNIDTSITVEQLNHLINTSKAYIQTTSEQSGTIQGFRQQGVKWHNSTTFKPNSYIDITPSIMLVNKMHCAKGLNIKNLTLISDSICTIPSYIYFTIKKDADNWKVEKRIKSFIDSIYKRKNMPSSLLPSTLTTDMVDFSNLIIKY